MKRILIIACVASFAFACSNAPTETQEQKKDSTSESSSADDIMKAVEKMKADSAAKHADSLAGKDSIKK